MLFSSLKQDFVLVYETAWFSQPSEVVPIGLTNDMDTLPYPTLVFKAKNIKPDEVEVGEVNE